MEFKNCTVIETEELEKFKAEMNQIKADSGKLKAENKQLKAEKESMQSCIEALRFKLHTILNSPLSVSMLKCQKPESVNCRTSCVPVYVSESEIIIEELKSQNNSLKRKIAYLWEKLLQS